MVPLPIGLNLAEVQNTYWNLKQTALPEFERRAVGGRHRRAGILKELLALGEKLSFAPHALELPAVMQSQRSQAEPIAVCVYRIAK